MRYVVIGLSASLISALILAALVSILTATQIPKKEKSWWDRQNAVLYEYFGFSVPKQPVIATGAATVGAGAGFGAVTAAGMTAAGMAGGGTGIGAAAGPVGAAVGALTGLAIYGGYKAFFDSPEAEKAPAQTPWFQFWSK
ncbi:MAG: hypothetical protein WCO00_07960 [Rhodospirillaceae bacterium]